VRSWRLRRCDRPHGAVFPRDSACHENGLLAWLKDPARAQEPGGAIGFAVSAVMSPALAAAVRAVADRTWKTFGPRTTGPAPVGGGGLRARREVRTQDSQPLRYVGLRLLKPQGVLFADGSDRHFHAWSRTANWTEVCY